MTKVKPMFTSIVTTGDRFEKDLYSGGLIVANKGDLKPWQTILFTGTSVRDLQVGDKVMVNFDNYAVKRYSRDSIQNDLDNNKTIRYMFNWLTLYDEKGDPQECLLLNDRDVLYSFEGEEKEDEETIQIPKHQFLA